MEILEQIINSSSTQSYDCEKNRINQLYSHLQDNLSGDELKTLEKIIKCQNKLSNFENMHFFINGFELGMSFAVESLN